MKKKELIELLENSNIFKLSEHSKVISIHTGSTRIRVAVTEKIEDVEASSKKITGEFLQYCYDLDSFNALYLTNDKGELKQFAKEELEKIAGV